MSFGAPRTFDGAGGGTLRAVARALTAVSLVTLIVAGCGGGRSGPSAGTGGARGSGSGGARGGGSGGTDGGTNAGAGGGAGTSGISGGRQPAAMVPGAAVMRSSSYQIVGISGTTTTASGPASRSSSFKLRGGLTASSSR